MEGPEEVLFATKTRVPTYKINNNVLISFLSEATKSRHTRSLILFLAEPQYFINYHYPSVRLFARDCGEYQGDMNNCMNHL